MAKANIAWYLPLSDNRASYRVRRGLERQHHRRILPFQGQIYSTVGLGATISRATDSGNFNLLIASTIVMAAIVVAINRLVWRRLYVLAETRFKIEA